MSASGLVENFFRREYASVVAVLLRRMGVQHISAVEDAVQLALIKALDRWTVDGLPENPSAWVYRVAKNNLLGTLRQDATRRRILEENVDTISRTGELEPALSHPEDVKDDLLRMLFVSCDSSIPIESQLVLALKTLCGFSVSEIALRLFTTDANVYKRYARARDGLRMHCQELDNLTDEQYAQRLPSVQKVIYLIFTEGYLSSHEQASIRRELCNEAAQLAELLADHPKTATPETHALLALMHLHMARMTARVNSAGGLLLLEEQDRSLWDRRKIATGLSWLEKSAEGDSFSRYHAEAGIAAAHCLAPSFDETRWDHVVECYELLESVTPSPIHRMNRAVAVAECKGPSAGLAILNAFDPPAWLANSYLWAAVLSDLHRRCGDDEKAVRYREVALDGAPTEAVIQLLRRRLEIGQ